MTEKMRTVQQDVAEMAIRVPVIEGDSSDSEKAAIEHRWQFVA